MKHMVKVGDHCGRLKPPPLIIKLFVLCFRRIRMHDGIFSVDSSVIKSESMFFLTLYHSLYHKYILMGSLLIVSDKLC